MKRRFVQQKDGHWPRSTRRSIGIRLPDLAIQVPVSHRVKLLLLGLPILFLLISRFFVGSPFASIDLNLRTSALVADRELIGQIQLPAPAALEEPLQSLQAARPQTDHKYKVTLQRLGKDEHNLVNLVTCLNDFDPVELVENSVDASDLSSDVISPEYQEGVPTVKVKGSLKRNVPFWEHIGASRFICNTIVDGYKIPFIYTSPAASFGNNQSAIQHSEFVEQAISDLFRAGSVVECGSAPTVVNPLSVSIQPNGKKRFILDLRYRNQLFRNPTLNARTQKPYLIPLSIFLSIGYFPLKSNLVIIILTFFP